MVVSDAPHPTAHIAGTNGDSRRDADDGLSLLSHATDSLPVGVLLVGQDGVIGRANLESQRLFGYTAGELVGQSMDMLVTDASPAAQTSDANPLARLTGPGRELFGRRKDGSEFPVEVRLTPLSFGGVSYVLISVVGLTSRHGLQAGMDPVLDEQLEFERLVGELGAELGNLHPGEVDRSIEDALGRLVRILGLDRSALFQVTESGDFVHTHQWTRPGWAPPLARVSARERFPWHLARVRAGELVSFGTLDEVPDAVDRNSLRHLGTKSSVTIPLQIGTEVWGALTFAAVREPRVWTAAEIHRFRVVALLFANALARKTGDEYLRKTLDEITSVKERLRQENLYLRQELTSLTGTAAVVGHSPPIRRVLEQVRQVAPTDSTVLLAGETGTGKTLLATHIHELSARSKLAMVRVNCAHLSPAWLEGEPGASEPGMHAELRRAGHLQLAHGSTVFLDEIADLPLEAQASLTRVLQDRQIRPFGTMKPVQMDIRIIAATRKDLKRCMEEGSFRDDLYYRLNVFPIDVPPLRERREDIPLLVWRFVDVFSEAYGKPVDAIDEASMAALQAHAWPGNVRELRNLVERAMIVPTGRRLRIPPPSNGAGSPRRSDTLAAIEKEHIGAVLAACGGWRRGRGRAATRLGLTPQALERKMTKLGVPRPEG